MCVYERDRDKQRHTERDREKEIQKETDIETHRNRDTQREKEFSNTEMKYLRQKQLKEREIHSDCISEVSRHGHLVPSLWACGEEDTIRVHSRTEMPTSWLK